MPRTTLMVLMVLVSSVAPAAEQCSTNDQRCLERNYEIACRIREAGAEGCSRFLHELQSRSDASSASVQLLLGHTLRALSEFPGGDADARERLRERGIAIYRQVLADNPKDVEALYSVANVTPRGSEHERLLRRIVDLAPEDVLALQFLAHNLSHKGGQRNQLEAAQLLEQAYAAQTDPKSHLNRWHLAAEAIHAYNDAGAAERAAALRRRARAELAIPSLAAELVAGGAEVTRIGEILSTLCYPAAISTLGAADCVQGIDSVVRSTEGMRDRARAQQLAEVAAAAMVNATQAQPALQKVDPEWREAFARAMDGLIAQGLGSVRVLDAYARVTPASSKKVSALENAARLAPADGGVAINLGVAYLIQERWDEAVEQFHKAKGMLPASQHEVIDYYLSVAAKERQRNKENRKVRPR